MSPTQKAWTSVNHQPNDMSTWTKKKEKEEKKGGFPL
jgi:hypothetical protein